MIVLAIETATPQVGVALVDDGGSIVSFHAARDRRHAETLVPAIEYLCRTSSVALSEIDVIGVDVGPGLFTGLRVGLATAKSMAFALDVPMVAATSLEVLARSAELSSQPVVAVVDARRGEVFHQVFVAGAPMTEPAVCTPAELVDILVAGGFDEPVIVGDGAARYADLFGHTLPGTRFGSSFPSAVTVGEVAVARASAGEAIAEHLIVPMYLRRPDAVANWATVSGQNGGQR